jgi:hypothetical protein
VSKVTCDVCGKDYGIGDWYRCPHGKPTLVMIGDSIPGGQILENLDAVPTRYDSKSEIKRRAEVLGVENRVRHIGLPGSDKSPFTTRHI